MAILEHDNTRDPKDNSCRVYPAAVRLNSIIISGKYEWLSTAFVSMLW